MNCVIALGFFDGIHIGHGALLRMARRRADELGCAACLLTFDTHPDTLVFGTKVPLINTPADRQAIAKEYYGIDRILTVHFDRATMQMPWEDFVVQLQTYGAVHVVCGHDFRFGDHGLGNASRLKEKTAALGIGCDVVGEVKLDGVTVSSTYIRQLLQNGEIARANRYLGHPHRLTGTVTSGIRTAGFLLPPDILPPKFGVYATRVRIDHASYIAATNVGICLSGEGAKVESWLPDFNGDLQGREIRVEFYQRLRDAKEFSSTDALQAQIRQDAQRARAFFLQNP